MQTLRIFISSPGDVLEERERAKDVVHSLRRRYARKFTLLPVVWEDLPLEPDMSFQQGIDLFLKNPGTDVAVFILWSRLGSPLGPTIRKADGSTYRSGTEREYDLMLQARAQTRASEGRPRPRMIVYTRNDDPTFDARLRGKTTAEKQEMLAQKKLVESFMKETFNDFETGDNISAHHPFTGPVTFTSRLRTHLQAILDELAGDMDEVIWDSEKQGPPFLGLEAFQPRHADVFFGREEEILEARNALKAKAATGCAFLLLSGASGSGKSSLARAGILPEILAHEPDTQAEFWRSLIVTPAELGADPILGLLEKLAAAHLLPELASHVTSLPRFAGDLARDAAGYFAYGFPQAIQAATARLGGGLRLVLVLDQLEELFTKDAVTKEARRAFLALVEVLARSGHFWIIATARSDFYQEIQSEPALVRMKDGPGLRDVLPPEPDALSRLITEPARLAGLGFEEKDGLKLSDRILRDAADHAELLPLLEFVLLELFNQADAQNQLTHAAYEALACEGLSGVEGALRGKAEATYAALPGDAQQTLGTVLRALVTLGEDGRPGATEKAVRLQVPRAQFAAHPAADKLVSAFIAARLFTAAQGEGGGEATVTLAHESLLRVWPRAVEWRRQNTDFLRARARIAARMKEGSPLLAGDPLLETAKAFLATRRDGFSAEQAAWIEQALAAAAARERHVKKRRQLAFAALSLLTLLALAASAWALKSEGEARAALKTTEIALAESDTAKKTAQAAEQSALDAKAETEAALKTAKAAKSTAEGLINSMLFDLRDKLQPLGRVELLDDVSKQAEAYFRENTATYPAAQRNEAAMWANRGNVLVTSGDLKAARTAFEKTLAILQRLADADPLNAQAQRDLSTSYNKLGDIARAEGDLAAARTAFEKYLAISQRLADADPRTAQAQRDLSVSYNKLGAIAQAEGDLAAARTAFEKSSAILQHLADADPRNAQAQLDLSAGYDGLGAIAQAEGDLAAARTAFEKALAIDQRRADADPGNALAQRNLSISYNKLGAIAQLEGDLPAARTAFEKNLAISQRLAEADPRNAEVQRDLSISHNNLGDIARAEGDLAAARSAFEKVLGISQRLADADPRNADTQRDLSVICGRLGSIAQAEGDLAAARTAFEKALAISQRLAEADPRNAEVQRDLVVSYFRLGELARLQKDDAAVLDYRRECLKVLKRMDTSGMALDKPIRTLYEALQKEFAAE